MSQTYANSTRELHSSFSGASSLLPPAEHATNYPPLPLERHNPPPPTNLLYADQYVMPAHASRLPGTGASGQGLPPCFDNSPDAGTGGQVDRSVAGSVRECSGHGPSGAKLWQSSTHHSFVEMPAEQQSPRPPPVASPYPVQPTRPGPQAYSSYLYPPSVPAPSLQRPPAANITVKHVTAGQAFQVYPPEAAFHTTQVPGYSGFHPIAPIC